MFQKSSPRKVDFFIARLSIFYRVSHTGVFQIVAIFFQRRENEMAEFTLKNSAITPFLIFYALKFALWPALCISDNLKCTRHAFGVLHPMKIP